MGFAAVALPVGAAVGRSSALLRPPHQPLHALLESGGVLPKLFLRRGARASDGMGADGAVRRHRGSGHKGSVTAAATLAGESEFGVEIMEMTDSKMDSTWSARKRAQRDGKITAIGSNLENVRTVWMGSQRSLADS